MEVRVADVHDLDDVLELLRAQFDEHGIDLPAGELPEALRGLLSDKKRGRVLLACDPDPAGIAVLAYTWTLEHGGQVAWLDELFVIPGRRGQGVGLALLRRAIEVAREGGCRAVELEVDAERERAEHLYEREGFRRLPRHRWAKGLREE
ncbi:MAG TPA: GNAT family N-acetyltransferase [Polyangiaceae bacterium]|nr:GNAT family N-acetyltransferase [Polyangiaceae bacterium]